MAATLAWLHAARPEEVAETVGGFFPDLDAGLLARYVERYRGLDLWTETPRFPPEALSRLEAAMLSAGAIRRSPGFAGLVEEELTEAALG